MTNEIPTAATKRRWPLYVIGAVVLIVMFASCNSGGDVQEGFSEGFQEGLSTAQSQPQPQTQAPQTEAAASEEAAVAEDEIGDGLHIVGRHIEPGTYESEGAKKGIFEFCMWSTRDGASSNSEMIDFGSANADERMVVEITPDVAAFESNGCEPWTKIG